MKRWGGLVRSHISNKGLSRIHESYEKSIVPESSCHLILEENSGIANNLFHVA